MSDCDQGYNAVVPSPYLVPCSLFPANPSAAGKEIGGPTFWEFDMFALRQERLTSCS